MTDLDTWTDAQLVAACRRGEPAAWGALVRRYQRLVYTVPRRAGLDEAAAADVFQAAFAKLFEQLDRLQQPDRVQAWLVTTAKRETLAVLRERGRWAAPPAAAGDAGDDPLDRIADPSPLPEALLDELQQQHRLRRALERLDERSRMLLTLLFLQDEPPPYSEIAARCGMPEGSIGPTRARALAKLRALLAEDGDG
ncbi:MAG TPA: sigma-70 family RNA polymerase sigma factor [Methylibium sp.]|nr:sigma-70 family RNA polymerase sigma factor [Methylibium sp.]